VAARLARVVERALMDADLSLPQYRLLTFLREGRVAAGALAGRLAVSRPAITTLVDGLVARGLVDRSPVEGDRRRVDHVLTPAGGEALAKADAAVEAALVRLVAHLPANKRKRAVEGLELWGHALDAARAERLEAR
jgi:DNA-binding MarR family transcriptional regulator